MSSPRRVMVYAQHLSGVGHYVRARELAQGLAERHEVALVEGGHPVPRPRDRRALRRIALPGLRRGGRGLEPTDPGRALGEVLGERRERLERAASELAPDLLVVEHYPFSKWELEPEIRAAASAARRANPRLASVCSIRDVIPRTRHEAAEGYSERVCQLLGRDFDAIWMHVDPRFTRIEEHFDGAGKLSLPVVHTGFVSEKPLPARSEPGEVPLVVASAGGGATSAGWLGRLAEAWRCAQHTRALERHRLILFGGAFWDAAALAALRRRADGLRAEVRPFSGEFLHWLQRADVSVSRAGYNTSTNLLETRVRAVLVPDPRMSDQAFRARRLADCGVAEVVEEAAASPERLAEALCAAAARPRPQHDFDLDGARRCCELAGEF